MSEEKKECEGKCTPVEQTPEQKLVAFMEKEGIALIPVLSNVVRTEDGGFIMKPPQIRVINKKEVNQNGGNL